jgi:outer membrane protein W
MKTVKFAFVVTLLLVALPAAAQDRSVDVTGWVTWTDISGNNTITGSPGNDLDFDFDSVQGFGAAINVFWSNRISTEFAFSILEPDLTFAPENPAIPVFAGGSLDMMPITLTLQYHFNPNGRFDPYIGAGVAYVLFDDVDGGRNLGDVNLSSIDVDDDYGFVLNAGVSIDLTRSLALNLDAKYVPVDAAATAVFTSGPGQAFNIEVNPLILAAGLQFQF